jgi:hypothetical protein
MRIEQRRKKGGFAQNPLLYFFSTRSTSLWFSSPGAPPSLEFLTNKPLSNLNYSIKIP